MQRAIEAAKACGQEIAIGAVIVKNGEVISSACNKKEENQNSSGGKKTRELATFGL